MRKTFLRDKRRWGERDQKKKEVTGGVFYPMIVIWQIWPKRAL
jgi:hypothetical protein